MLQTLLNRALAPGQVFLDRLAFLTPEFLGYLEQAFG